MNYRKMFYFAVAASYIMYCSCKSLSLMYMEKYTDINIYDLLEVPMNIGRNVLVF